MCYIPCLRRIFAEGNNEFDIREGIYLADLAEVSVERIRESTHDINLCPWVRGVSSTLQWEYKHSSNAYSYDATVKDTKSDRTGSLSFDNFKIPQPWVKLTVEDQAYNSAMQSEDQIIKSYCGLRSERMSEGILLADLRCAKKGCSRDEIAREPNDVQERKIDCYTASRAEFPAAKWLWVKG